MIPRQGHLLRIFIGEDRRRDGVPLYDWIVRRAREQGMAGATVLRGLEGFGARSRVHRSSILRLSSDLPIVIEIVDSREKLEAFLASIEGAIDRGLATLEQAEVLLFRGAGEAG